MESSRARDIHILIRNAYPDFPADLLLDIINLILIYEIKQPIEAKGDI
jgi:hypothetical protein